MDVYKMAGGKMKERRWPPAAGLFQEALRLQLRVRGLRRIK
jgi:hypothetical protein